MTQSTNQLVVIAKKFAVPAAIAAAFALGAVLFVGHGNVQAASAMDDNSVSALTSLDHAMEAVAARVTPAVVNIAVTARTSGDQEGPDGQGGGQMQGLPPGLRQFFGPMTPQQPQQPQIEHGVGSGIIISPDGYIVTNNHVVDGAVQVKVTLHDRRVLDAKVIGTDKLTDLAVSALKFNRDGTIEPVAWAIEQHVKNGLLVVAAAQPLSSSAATARQPQSAGAR